MVIFVQNNEVPHIASYETHQRSQEISIVTPKRLLQQYLPKADMRANSVEELSDHAFADLRTCFLKQLHRSCAAASFQRNRRDGRGAITEVDI